MFVSSNILLVFKIFSCREQGIWKPPRSRNFEMKIHKSRLHIFRTLSSKAFWKHKYFSCKLLCYMLVHIFATCHLRKKKLVKLMWQLLSLVSAFLLYACGIIDRYNVLLVNIINLPKMIYYYFQCCNINISSPWRWPTWEEAKVQRRIWKIFCRTYRYRKMP